jgi:tagaturonate epimerase
MYRHALQVAPERDLEFEVAVDEIEHPTTLVDHVYMATELRRLGVRWQSFAPRFTGEFEKGIDYRGDLASFAADVAGHAAVARTFGPYKLSVHSGSDKFSVYDEIVRATGRLVHLKTSGTSYLEGLRVLARIEPDLVRTVWRVALEAYSTARASYRVSATIGGMPAPERLTLGELAGLLDTPDTREILHVTYGAVLGPEGNTETRKMLGGAVRGALWANRQAYWDDVAAHIGRHLISFESGVAVGRSATTTGLFG